MDDASVEVEWEGVIYPYSVEIQCTRCSAKGTRDKHPCPVAVDLEGNDAAYCYCCAYCFALCRDEV